VFLHTNSRLLQKENLKATPSTIATKLKYLGTNLTKEIKDLYNKTEKLMNEFEEDTKNWNDISFMVWKNLYC
jgi:hypothetical protein